VNTNVEWQYFTGLLFSLAAVEASAVKADLGCPQAGIQLCYLVPSRNHEETDASRLPLTCQLFCVIWDVSFDSIISDCA